VWAAVRLICQLLEALEYPHAKGFVHRDVKPSNLLVYEEGGRQTVKVADFGLARVYQASQLSGLTLQNELGGTAAYMPPEQITDFRNVRPTADQYSSAATLYRLLTGRHVHGRHRSRLGHLRRGHRRVHAAAVPEGAAGNHRHPQRRAGALRRPGGGRRGAGGVRPPVGHPAGHRRRRRGASPPPPVDEQQARHDQAGRELAASARGRCSLPLGLGPPEKASVRPRSEPLKQRLVAPRAEAAVGQLQRRHAARR
jgi:serine/threonine protein kinase